MEAKEQVLTSLMLLHLGKVQTSLHLFSTFATLEAMSKIGKPMWPENAVKKEKEQLH